MADNALCASKMNVGPGGKQPNMHNIIIPLSNPFRHGGQTQCLVCPEILPDSYPYKKFKGKPKGMHVIAEKCGYLTNPEGKCMVEDCM
jgi:hypothetical protein